MTAPKLPPLPRAELDALLDFIYEFGTNSEGIGQRARAFGEAYALAVRAQALEEAAKVCEARRDARFQEYGITEPDTGAQYYGRDTGEHEFDYRDDEDDDCAAAIRVIAAKEKA